MTLIGHWEIIIKQCIFNIQLSRNVGSFYFQNKGLVISVNKLKFNLTLFQTVKGVKKFILMVILSFNGEKFGNKVEQIIEGGAESVSTFFRFLDLWGVSH